jgi:hypothetical protein
MNKETVLNFPNIELRNVDNSFSLTTKYNCFASGIFKTKEEAVKFISSQLSNFFAEIIMKSLSETYTFEYLGHSYPNLPNTLTSETAQNYAATNTKKHIT